MTDRRARWAMAGILVLYLGLGVAYTVITPVFEAPDESHHFFFVKHLVDHRALPTQNPETRDLWSQEGSQPPLYYLVGALLVSGIDLSDAQDLLWGNPQANIGDPVSPGNKNVYIHPQAQDYPWEGAVLAVHVLRFFSIVLGAGTVLFVWHIARLLASRSLVLPLVVAAVTAFVPQFLFISASVSNDNAMTLLGTLSLYLLLWLLRNESSAVAGGLVSARRWVLLGCVLGLALLSKLSALVLLPLAGIVIALTAWHRRSWRAAWRACLIVGSPMVAIAGWWYVRNVVLYGDPTGLTAMWEVVGKRHDFGQDLWGEFRALRYSFWGLFGWFSLPMSVWVYRVLDVLSLLAATGLVIEVGRWLSLGLWRAAWSAWRYREPGWGAAYRPLGFGLLSLWLLALAVSLLRWTSLTPGTQGRLLFPALAPCVMSLVLGLRAWFLYRGRDAASAVLALCMFGLAAATPWSWIAPFYARPVERSVLPEDAIPMDLTFGEAIVLRGVGFAQDAVSPGGVLAVDLYWEAVRPLTEHDDFMVVLQLAAPTGDFVGVEDAYPGSGAMPASLWPTGRLLAARQYVSVGADAPAPLIAHLGIGLYLVADQENMPCSGDSSPIIGRVKIVPRTWPKIGAREMAARFDWENGAGSDGSAGARLAAAEWPTVVHAGDPVSIRLTWMVLSPPRRDYAVFVHLEDGAGNVYGYGDGAPRGGLYPTWAWAKGEVVRDDHALLVNPDTPAGSYHVRVGLYDSAGRVQALGMDGVRWPDDAVDLGAIEVR